MITVAEFNQVDQLKPLARCWDRLWNQTPTPCFSQTMDWIEAFAGCGGKLRVLLAMLGGRPFGIWPLAVEKRATDYGELRCLRSAGESLAPFAGPVGRNTTAMLSASLRHVQKTRRDWDMVDFQFASGTERDHRRIQNAFRLVGWTVEADAVPDWREVRPETVASENSRPRPSRFTLERIRAEEQWQAPWPFLAACLTLVEDAQGAESANRLRQIHQAAYRAGIADWCLLKENGVPRAAALNVFTRGRWISTALIGRTESDRQRLFQLLLDDARDLGDEPYWFRASELPDSTLSSHATPAGFRYTHISPWAIKARWQRFCRRFGTGHKNQPELIETNHPSMQPSSTPPRPKLTIYRPASAETLKA